MSDTKLDKLQETFDSLPLVYQQYIKLLEAVADHANMLQMITYGPLPFAHWLVNLDNDYSKLAEFLQEKS
jgi:hypothetical protein